MFTRVIYKPTHEPNETILADNTVTFKLDCFEAKKKEYLSLVE